MKMILGLFLMMISLTAYSQEQDCRQGRILVNAQDSTDREGFIRVMQILATGNVRDSVLLQLPSMDPRTGVRPVLRTTSFLLVDAFPKGTPEFREGVRLELNAAMAELQKIPGVIVSCGRLPDGPFPRVSGGF